jgi:hypothetical protein
MISAISVYDDVIKDSINKWESEYASIEMFNRLSKRAELAILDWLSGDVAGQLPPEPWVTQKNKDWLSPFIKRLPVSVDNGFITRPSDYYKYEDSYRLTKKVDDDCEEEDEVIEADCDVPITLLDSDKFNQRCVTYIEGKKPSLLKPIGKIVGGQIELRPRDIGSATLQYIRYPIFAQIGKMVDPVYNDEVPDPNNTVDFEWDEWTRPALIYFITDYFANHTREQALKQFNQATGKSPRG